MSLKRRVSSWKFITLFSSLLKFPLFFKILHLKVKRNKQSYLFFKILHNNHNLFDSTWSLQKKKNIKAIFN